MTILSIIISTLMAFGLGDIVDVLESDEVESALNIAESFQHANRAISEVEEYYIGRSVAANVLNMYVPLDDLALQQYVNLIGQAIATSCPKPTLVGGYHFLVENSSDINAIACPGGLILII